MIVRRQAGGILVDVLAVAGGNRQRAGGGAVGDRDVALVGVDRGHAFRGVRQRRREHVAGARALGRRSRPMRFTVASVMVSVTLAVAVPVPTTRLSKLPPETPVIVRRQAGGVLVDVLAVAGGDRQRAGGGAVGDGDVALVGVDRGHALRGVRQRRREHVAGARALGRRSRPMRFDRGVGDGVGDVGGGRAGADHQALEVAAGDAGDRAPSGCEASW